MTTTSWHKLFGLGACAALLAAACTVSSGSDDDDGVTTGTTTGKSTSTGGSGGSGGSSTTSSGGSAGEGSGGTTTTSTTATATTGDGGEPGITLECLDENDPGTSASCDIEDTDNCCTKCIRTNFCDEYGACFASPTNICAGTTDEDSEFYTFANCMFAIEGGALPGIDNNDDFDGCIAEATDVSDKYCGLGTISGATNDLVTKVMGDDEGLGGCFAECLDSSFDESECIY